LISRILSIPKRNTPACHCNTFFAEACF